MERKFALITGGAGGFGKVLTKALLEKTDYQIALADIDLERVSAAAQSLGENLHYFQVDASDEESVRKLYSNVADTTKSIDLLICAHGVTAGRTSIQDVPLDEWTRVIDINLTGVFLMMKHCIPLMTSQHSGCIINLTTGDPVRRFASTYVASKIGVEGLTAAASQDLKDSNIVVYAVAPGGYTATPFHDNSYRLLHYKNYESTSQKQTEQRGLKPEVIVPLCLHLVEKRPMDSTGKKLIALDWNKQNGLGYDVWYV